MAVTCAFEQICSRDMFGDVRAQWKMSSRKKKDRRERFAKGLPNPLKWPGANATDGSFVPVTMPIFELPGQLIERPKDKGFHVKQLMAALPSISGDNRPPHDATMQISFGPFMRMLAKIAYAAAVAEYGMSNIPKSLVPYILGADECLSHVVGGCSYPFDPPPSMVVDKNGGLALEPFLVGAGIWRGHGRRLFVTRVQILRFLNTPTYWVVVGAADDQLATLVEAPSRQPTLI